MNKESLLEIAKAGFPEHTHELIHFEELEFISISGVSRLYYKDTPFRFMLPEESILTLYIGANNFIQFTCGNIAFNQYAAIEKLKELNFINQ